MREAVDKLLVKNNSRKHFVRVLCLDRSERNGYKNDKRGIVDNTSWTHITWLFFKPEEKGCFPLVIMSHGYNGCKDDFEKQRNTLLMQKSHRLHVHFVGEVQGTSLVFQQRR